MASRTTGSVTPMPLSALTMLRRNGTARSSRERTRRVWLCPPAWHKRPGRSRPRARGQMLVTLGLFAH
jgi:hypothetical protein